MTELITPRLRLRKFKPDDFGFVHSYASCRDNIKYMVWNPNTEEDTKNFIAYAIKSAESAPVSAYEFIAEIKKTRVPVGACDIVLSADSDEAEVGWTLHRDFWRLGYGTEMGQALLSFGFDTLSLHRIIAHCDSENIASYSVMERIGMRREGLFIEARPPYKGSPRKYSDEYSYAILKREWEAQRK